ncbi:MAG: DUF6134 family protein, partial [Caulobacterales bacterium]
RHSADGGEGNGALAMGVSPWMKAIVGGAALLVLSTAPASAETLSFDVFRNGSPFGSHVVTLTRQGEFLKVNSKLRMEVKLGPITVFTYQTECNERWKAKQLETLTCLTLKNGAKSRIDIKRFNERLAISINGKDSRWLPNLAPISPWNMYAVNDSQTLALEDGKVLPLASKDFGKEKIKIGGKTMDARRIRYTSALVVDSWYDSRGRWLKAKFKASGENIEYRLKV